MPKRLSLGPTIVRDLAMSWRHSKPDASSCAMQVYNVTATQPSGQNSSFLCVSVNGSYINGFIHTVDNITVDQIDNSNYVQNVELLLSAFSKPDASVFYNQCAVGHKLLS